MVPLYNVEDYVRETLLSLISQSLVDCEFLVIDDASTDGSLEVAERTANEDSRIRILRKKRNSGLSETRNAGVAAARGKYVAFIDSDDVIQSDTFKAAVTSLESSASDFAVFGYYRFNRRSKWNSAPWIHSLHLAPETRTNATDRPDMLVNAIACSKVFRKSFWKKNSLGFRPGALYEDQALTARAYALARSVDILPDFGLGWRAREDGSSISQQVHTVLDLRARVLAAEETLWTLSRSSRPNLFDERLCQLLTNDFPQSVGAVPLADLEYFEVARELGWVPVSSPAAMR